MTRLFAAWVDQVVGYAVAPRVRIQQRARSIAGCTYLGVPDKIRF
jgi:hypothetical protein